MRDLQPSRDPAAGWAATPVGVDPPDACWRSIGHVLVTGGLLSLTNDNVWIGREGNGDLTISIGTVRALGGFVALSTVVTDSITLLPVTNVPSGTLTLAGGSSVLTSNLVVGTASISTGHVSVVGGNLVGRSADEGGGPGSGVASR